MNLYDIMRSAGGDDAFSALGAQHGLGRDEMVKALEALLPAFSTGLKRSTADARGLLELMRHLALFDYVRAFQNPAWAAGAGKPGGEEAISFLFGSPEAARAVSEQAAAFAGLAQEKLAELMAPLAAIAFGGLAKQASAQNPILDAILKQFGSDAAPKPPAGKGPLDRYEQEQADREREEAPANLARMQETMAKAGLAAFEAGTATWQSAMSELVKAAGGKSEGISGEPAIRVSGRDLFGEMFEPGLRLSEAYRSGIEAAIERTRGGADRD